VGAYDNGGNYAPYKGTASSGYYNSNSYAFTLLQDIGLGSYFGTPSLAPGWGKTVPGL